MAFSSGSAKPYNPISLPLYKLSYCTTANLHAKLLWEHLLGESDMYAVFDHVRKSGLGLGVSARQILKLVRRGDLLEEIDLENLAYQVRLDDERCRSQQIQDRDRNVLLVIKHPAVALRYQIPTGQIRRIQLNFQPDAGYDVAVRIFRSLGVPVQDKNAAIYGSQDAGSRSVSPRHPHPAQPYPIYSMGTQMNTESLPKYTTQYPTESPTLGTIPSFEMPSAAANMPYDGRLQSPAHGPFDSLGSPSRDLGLGGFSGHLQDPALQERASTSYSQYFPSASAVQQSLLRPTTAPTTLSQLMPPKRELPFPKATPELTANPFIEESNRSDTNQVTDFQTTAKPAKTGIRAKRQAKAPRSRPPSSIAKTRPASRQKKPLNEPPLHLACSRALRSRDAATSNAARLDDSPTKNTPASKVLSGQANPAAPDPGLTTSEQSRTPDDHAANNNNNNNPPTANPPNKPTPREEIPPSKASSSPLPTSTATPPLPSQQQLSTTDFTTVSTTTRDQQQQHLERLEHWIRKFHDVPTPTIAPPLPLLPPPPPPAFLPNPAEEKKKKKSQGQVVEEEEAYAALPEEERVKVLDGVVCDLIGDERFVGLVEDVERCWRRIGLGF